MARSRNIKPGFPKNADLAALGERAQLLFCTLWLIADREGRLKDDPRWIRAECLPYSEATVGDVDSLLTKLANGADPFLVRYSVDGKKYIQVVNWKEHQSPHHTEAESRIPACTVSSPLSNGDRTSKEQDAPESVNQRISESGIRNQESEPPKKAREKFTPPTLDEVRSHVAAKGYTFDPETFHAHYEANGWVQGSRGKPVRNWQACCVTFQKNHSAFAPRGSPRSPNDPRGNLALREKMLAELGYDTD